ncbi:MAG: polysaccharide biosynthesis protein [Methylocystis sp.]|nr:polysaccharide biosynthesis protein [Methylocystis sp.]
MLKPNLIANFVGQGWVGLMGLIFVPSYIYYLGIEAYGVIGLYYVLLTSLTLLDFGMTPTLSREIARFTGGGSDAIAVRDLLRSIETSTIILSILAILGVWAASGWLSTSWLRYEKLSPAVVAQAIAIMGVVCALRLVESIYRGCIIGLQRQVLLNGVSSALATLRGLGAVTVLAWIAPTIQAFFLWQGLISAVNVLILATATYQLLPRGVRGGRFCLSTWKRFGGFAGGMFSITIAGILLGNADKIVLLRLLTLTDYGYYTLAGLVASSLFTLIYPVTQAWAPRLNQLHAANDLVRFIQTYHQGAQLISVAAGSAAFFLIAFADVVLNLWTHDPVLTAQTSAVLRLLVFANLLNGLMNMPCQAQLAYRWLGLVLRAEFLAVVIIVPAILLATPRFGMEGAGWSLIALNAGYLLMTAQFMYRRILVMEKWKWYCNDILFPLTAAAFVAFCSRGVLMLLPGGSIEYWSMFALSAAMTLAAAWAAAPSIRRQTIDMAAFYAIHMRLNRAARLDQ